jgi:hypothetical protein
MEMTKLPNQDGNPWRVSSFKAVPIWYDGNIKILTSDPDKIKIAG